MREREREGEMQIDFFCSCFPSAVVFTQFGITSTLPHKRKLKIHRSTSAPVLQYADFVTEGRNNDTPGQDRCHTPFVGRSSDGKEAEEGCKGTFSG